VVMNEQNRCTGTEVIGFIRGECAGWARHLAPVPICRAVPTALLAQSMLAVGGIPAVAPTGGHSRSLTHREYRSLFQQWSVVIQQLTNVMPETRDRPRAISRAR